jgi:tetratricopeptide (TPR) repeat protein
VKDETISLLERALDRRPYFPAALQNLGMMLAALGRFEEATTSLREAVRQRPENADVRHTLAFCLNRLGRLDEAIEQYDAARRLAPENLRVLREYGETLYAARRYAEAAAMFREGLGLDPEDPDLKLALAWVLATSPDASVRDGIEALRLAESALRRRNDPEATDIYAAALAEVGRFDEAAETAKRAAASAAARQQTALAEEIRRRKASYESGHPFRP